MLLLLSILAKKGDLGSNCQPFMKTLVFKKLYHIFAENSWKSPKMAVITMTKQKKGHLATLDGPEVEAGQVEADIPVLRVRILAGVFLRLGDAKMASLVVVKFASLTSYCHVWLDRHLVIPPNTSFTISHIWISTLFSQMCRFFYKFVENESYQIFTNICKPNLAYFTSIFKKFAQNDQNKNCPTKLYWSKITNM
jgi:hypothetical protein